MSISVRFRRFGRRRLSFVTGCERSEGVGRLPKYPTRTTRLGPGEMAAR
jgi:hypothetical protein